MANNPVDHLGRKFKRGDIISYSVRGGSSMWISHAVVEEVLFEHSPWDYKEQYVLRVIHVGSSLWNIGTHRRTKVYKLNNCLILDWNDVYNSQGLNGWAKAATEISERLHTS